MSASHFKYALVGGGLASSAALQAIRRRDSDGSILLVGAEVNRPYHRCALSKDYLLRRTEPQRLFTLPDHWFAENRVELRTACRATRLDASRHVLSLDSGDEIVFDTLLIATGAAPRPLQGVKGAQLPNVFPLRTLADAQRLRNALEQARREGRPHAHGRGKAIIVGAGLMGMELAATLHQAGLSVDVITPGAHSWDDFAGENTGRLAARYLDSRGIRLHTHTGVQRLEGDGRVQRVIIPDQPPLDCDFVIVAMGIVPNRNLIRGTTIAAEKAILVDERCRTSNPDVFAAGDCAAIMDRRFGRYRIIDHAAAAQVMGEVAGTNMAGGDAVFDHVSQFKTEVLGLRLAAWGDARSVERRIMRGNVNPDAPDFLEIGIAADGRIAQVLAVNYTGEAALLEKLVAERAVAAGKEELLRAPDSDLASLM